MRREETAANDQIAARIDYGLNNGFILCHIECDSNMLIQPAPFACRNCVGRPTDYFIHEGYTVRTDNEAFDDTPFTDEFQLEVYQYARQVADRDELKSVCDVGCGSGFKLVTNFYDLNTIGLEVPKIVQWLRKRWPGRRWQDCDFQNPPLFAPDLVMCSDVIEHLLEPNELLDFIKRLKAKSIILSTPERDQLCNGTYDGPPHNVHHVREWNFAEFSAYIASWFHIREHFVINGTQVVDCHI
jgi:hypothetical protein